MNSQESAGERRSSDDSGTPASRGSQARQRGDGLSTPCTPAGEGEGTAPGSAPRQVRETATPDTPVPPGATVPAPSSRSGEPTPETAQAGVVPRPPGPLPGEAPDDDRREETVGEFDTVASGSTQWLDGIAEWTEGLLVAGRYRIVRFIGQGGMGKVYLAHDEMLERHIALKRIPQEILFDADARDDLRQEANRLLDLTHDNVVRIHTYYDGPTWPFIAMEYLQGPTLKQLLRARRQYGRTFTVAESLAIATQVARGLSYAHSKGVIHRDLKPGNLMLADTPGDVLGRDVVVKITDFGISRVVADGSMRQTGKRTGTLPYMSPEQYRGELSTAKSDIYSLACTLYEFLSGRPPFYTGDIGYQIISVAPKPLPDVPKSVSNAILRGLAKDPNGRYDSVDHFLQALEGKIHVSLPRIHRERFYRPLRMGAACLVMVLAFLLGSFYQARTRPVTERPGAPLAARDAQRPVATSEMTDEQMKEEFDRFSSNLWGRLESEIKSMLGRNDGVGAAGGGPTISVSFRVPEPTDSTYLRQLYDGLSFQCYDLEDSNKEPAFAVRDSRSGVERTFTITDLVDGSYGLQAYVSLQPNSSTPKLVPVFTTTPLRFTVDLTPPRVEVKVVQAGLLLDTQEDLVQAVEEPVEWLTFAEAIDLGLETTEEIASASFRKILPEGATPWQIIVDPRRFRLPLTEGTNTFRVTASDRAGNPSREVSIVLRRLQLEVKSFGLDGPVRGDLAKVRGHLHVEGANVPELRYFVNGLPVADEDPTLVALEGEAGPVSSMEFTAKLRLPEPRNNKIEVRYALNRDSVQTFAQPAAVRIDGVSVQPPDLYWSREIPASTRDSILTLKGRVDPYFKGLTLSIENLKRSTHMVDLIPNAVDDTASFVQEIPLSPNQEHVFRVSFFYKEHPLLPAPPLIRVASDQRPPYLLEEPGFNRDGEDFLTMTMRPSEELRSLRVFDRGSWQEVKPRFFDLSVYLYNLPVPREETTLRIEMEDLAGNEANEEVVCTITRSDLSDLSRSAFRTGGAEIATAADVQSEDLRSREAETKDSETTESGTTESGTRGSTTTESDTKGSTTTESDTKGSTTTESDTEGSTTTESDTKDSTTTESETSDGQRPVERSSTSGLELRSPFLQELDLDFRSFTPDRLEMGTTEITERVWSRFLESRGERVSEPTDPERPHVFSREDASRLEDFVLWFQENAKDGYSYSIPTTAQWLCAFAGKTTDPEFAPEYIDEWFENRMRDGLGFNPDPAKRYGMNTPLSVRSRPENRTPTGLYDMEANVRELVRGASDLRVIGGHNGVQNPDELRRYCKSSELFAPDDPSQGPVGVRILRKPTRRE